MATIVNPAPSMNKNLVKALVLLAIVAVIIGGLYYLRARKPVQQQQATAFSVEKTDLEATEIPKGFPDSLPVEAGSTVQQNYEATTADGRVQSTRVMTTDKSLAVAVETYQSFFASRGWKSITGNSDGSTTVLMLNGDNSLLIVGAESNNQRTVSLTLTEAR